MAGRRLVQAIEDEILEEIKNIVNKQKTKDIKYVEKNKDNKIRIEKLNSDSDFRMKYIKYKKKYVELKKKLGGANEVVIDSNEEIQFILDKCIENNVNNCSRENVERVLNLYYNELNNIDPNPENHYNTMVTRLNLDIDLIQKIWEYQIQFLDSKGILVE